MYVYEHRMASIVDSNVGAKCNARLLSGWLLTIYEATPTGRSWPHPARR